jgi:hypothetical protein
MQQRRRFSQTSSLEQCLAKEAQNLRKQAEGMPAGIPRESLLRKARQAETASRVLVLASSPCPENAEVSHANPFFIESAGLPALGRLAACVAGLSSAERPQRG